VIKTARYGITPRSPLVIDIGGESPSTAAIRVALPPSTASVSAEVAEDRAEDLASHLDFLWRFACRMGVGSATAEDIAQEAFVIALGRADAIVHGKERSYLLSIVVNMVRRERTRRSRHEELTEEPTAREDDAPDRALDDKRARALLDRSLDALDDDLRAVFVLHEIEEETMADIAQMLDLAPGTVASRLRRARDEWKRATDRLRREAIGGAFSAPGGAFSAPRGARRS
jgi:RNA polymerase sigma-70 factor (ECF subfamily)